MVQDNRIEFLDSAKDWIIRDEAGRMGSDHGGRLHCIRSPKPIAGTEFGREVCRFKIRRDPQQVGIGGKQTVECIDPVLVLAAIRRDQKFRHCDCGGHGLMTGPFHPGKDRLGERKIPGICL